MASFIQCKECLKLTEKHVGKCSCGHVFGRPIDDSAAIHMFPTGMWEHLAPEPIHIKGRAHLRDVCSDLDCRASILD